MKILIIMGSPRKKHGAGILKTIEEKINAFEKSIFEYIYLKKENIEDCRGCDQCFKKGDEFCPVKDNLNEIKKKMNEADGVIFVCPVYAHQITAPMKKFIDRLSYIFHRPRYFNKFSLIVATTASTGLKAVIDYLSLTAKGLGFYLLGRIGVISKLYFEDYSSFNAGYKDKVNNKIDKAVSKIIQFTSGRKKISPDLFSIIMFLAFKEKAKKLQADYMYWNEKGWFDANYYYKTNLGLFKSIASVFIKKIILPFVIK